MSATPSVFDKPLDGDINDVAEGLAILVDGDTAPRAISSGQYLFIKNHPTLATGGYHASSAIASGATISSSNVTADADGIANSINSSVTALHSNIANLRSRTLLKSDGPASSTSYTLSDSIQNYEYIEVFFRKSGAGHFVGQILSSGDAAVGTLETMSFSAYNNASYNFYAECGFSTNTQFHISTYRATGWTIDKVFIVGIGKK